MSVPEVQTPDAVSAETRNNPTPLTRLSRLVPALLLSQVGTYVALLTPLQLLLTLRLTELSASPTEATAAFGIVTGAGALCGLIANPLAGRLSDLTRARFGRRRTWIVTGAVGGALGLLAIAYASEIWQVVVLWCIVASLYNFQYAATQAVVADQVPAHRRGGVSGLLGIGITIGPVGGMALVNLLPAGSAQQWIVVAALAVVLSLAAVVLLRDRGADRRGETLGLRGILHTFWLNPLKFPAFGWAWWVRFLIMCAFASTSYNAFFLMQRFEVSTADVGGLVLVISIINIVTSSVFGVVCGYVSDAIRKQKPFVIASGVLGAVALTVQAFAPSVEVVFIAVGLLGAATGLYLSADQAMCVRVLPAGEDAGKDLGIINIANTLPQSFVPFAAPVLLALGGYNVLFLALAVCSLLGVFAVSKVPEIGQEAGGRWVVPVVR